MGANESNPEQKADKKALKEAKAELKRQEKAAKIEMKKQMKETKKKGKIIRNESTTKITVVQSQPSLQQQKSNQRVQSHLNLLKNKITQDSTFGAKLHEASPQRDVSSRLSGRKISTNYSPSTYKTKAADLDDPRSHQKKSAYSQYRPASSKIRNTNISPRRAAVVKHPVVMTEEAPPDMVLVPCPSCGRKFNPGNSY